MFEELDDFYGFGVEVSAIKGRKVRDLIEVWICPFKVKGSDLMAQEGSEGRRFKDRLKVTRGFMESDLIVLIQLGGTVIEGSNIPK